MDRDDQEAWELGELTEEMARERREVYDDRRDAPLYGQPGARVSTPTIHDVEQRNRFAREAERIPPRQVSVDWLVTSTYDARPVNGADFQFHRGSVFLQPAADPPITTGLITYQVPSGRVAVFRRFRWWPSIELATNNGDPAVTDLRDFEPLLFTLRINGTIIPDYDQIPQQAGERELYAIAGEGQSVEVAVRLNTAGPEVDIPDDYAARIFVELYGNMLVSTGRAQNFTPANRYTDGGRLK